MKDLIERLEKAEGPDRELDGDIAVAVLGGEIVWGQGMTGEAFPARKYQSRDHVKGFGKAPVDPYTASLDSALTLVPEPWTRDVDATCPECGIDVRLHGKKVEVKATHMSEPIATCIAALKARIAVERDLTKMEAGR